MGITDSTTKEMNLVFKSSQTRKKLSQVYMLHLVVLDSQKNKRQTQVIIVKHKDKVRLISQHDDKCNT